MAEEYHQTTWRAQKAIEFIESGAGFAGPWVFSVNIFDPHPCLDRLEDIPLPGNADGEPDDKPVFQRIDHAGAYGGDAGYPFTEMTDRDHRLLRAA